MSTPEQTGLTWHKSSYSNGDNGACVEVAWHKSSYSNANGEACVEVAAIPGSMAVRDSKHPEAGHLDFPPAAWHSFLTALRHR
ncbi:DUF397 domain-containing protein [Amycolatopsis nigrescens]|uniref:DUF397 domain-containing protein n=1 Tax=Amycolatopsis nigrescens TaxID=381445 RepID=UPI0003769693|nr:DUF397 domain-containing protein [Amycolatopsis nigrescens]